MNQYNNTTNSRNFKQLNYEKRIMIQTLLNEGYSQIKIAKYVGCNQSTISREIKRGSFTKKTETYFDETFSSIYEAHTAQNYSNKRNTNSHKKPACINKIDFIKDVVKQVKNGWSFEMIVGRIKQQNILNNTNNFYVSFQTLYNYVRKGVFKKYGLNSSYFPRMSFKHNKYQKIAKRDCKGFSINSRPENINNRSEAFNWEIDLIIGSIQKGNVLLTMTERKTRFELAFKLECKEAKHVTNQLDLIEKKIGLDNFKKTFKSLTSDNGSEFLTFTNNMSSCTVKNQNRTTQYFANAYKSWERGTNEAMNGCIRKFFPKKTKFENITKNDILDVIIHLNNRPKKCLGFRTSLEVILDENPDFLDIYESLKTLIA